MPDQDERPEQVKSIGAMLAELRHSRGLTGAELASRIGASQAKVSKLESGVTPPKPSDILAIGRALDVAPDVIRALIDRAESEPKPLGRWRAAGTPLGRWQHDIAVLEGQAGEIRTFQAAVPAGLLQTESYARAVLADYLRPLDQGATPGVVPVAVTERLRRQEVLTDPAKVFLFVLAETALLNRVAKPATMLDQVERIREVAAEPNILVRILRSGGELAYPPLHDFELLEDRAVIIDTMTTTVVTRDASDVQVYRRVFEYFWAQATLEIDPILDRYARRYAELAREAAGSAPGPPIAADLVAPPEDPAGGQGLTPGAERD